MRIRVGVIGVAAALAVASVATAAVAGSAGDPQFSPTAADATWAASMIPANADLGVGWSIESQPLDQAAFADAPDSSAAIGTDCPGVDNDLSDLVVTGGQVASLSPADTTMIDEEALVWQSAANATSFLDRQATTAVMHCVAKLIAKVSVPHVRFVLKGDGLLPFAPVASRVFAYRVVLDARVTIPARTRHGKPRVQHVPLTLDSVFLGSGRATVILDVVSATTPPFSVTYEESLATLVAGHMAADPAPAG